MPRSEDEQPSGGCNNDEEGGGKSSAVAAAAASADAAASSPENQSHGRLHKFGERYKVSAVRIAIGKKVVSHGCEFSFQSSTHKPFLRLAFKVEPTSVTATSSTVLSASGKSGGVQRTLHTISPETITEMKFFLGTDDDDEGKGKDKSTSSSVSDESSDSKPMSFLAMRVEPNDANGLSSYSNSYLQDVAKAKPPDCAQQKYIVVEFRSNDAFKDMLDRMCSNNTFCAFLRDQSSQLQPQDVGAFNAALVNDDLKRQSAEVSCHNEAISPPDDNADDRGPDDPSILRKRNRELEEESNKLRAKNQKVDTAIDTATDELVCPITLELPVDPVTAEDGKIYERSAIEQHIARNREGLKSPMTREPMGRMLLPATQVRNMIKSLVFSGTLSGDKADRWKQKVADEEEVADAKKKATEGDTEKMFQLACWYEEGEKGLPLDIGLAYKWFKAAADLHHIGGMGMAGFYLLHRGGENRVQGSSLLSIAASMGSESAAYFLGSHYMKGERGFPMDIAQAKYWLGKVADGSCSFKQRDSEQVREFATRKLQHLDRNE